MTSLLVIANAPLECTDTFEYLSVTINKTMTWGDHVEATSTNTGLEKYLNSTLPIGQVTLKFCLPGALAHLPEFSNSLIIHEPKNGSQTTGRHSPLGANHFHVYAIILPYFHNFQLLHSAFYKVSQFAIINMDEHSYNHIEVRVVCTIHCQILHHNYQLSQYNVIELFCLTAFRCLMAP